MKMIDLNLCRRIFPYALAAAAIVSAIAWAYDRGYQSAAAKYEKQSATERLAQSQAAERLQAAARAKEKESADKLAAALAARDKALADASALRRDSARVRERSATIARDLVAMSRADGRSDDRVVERLGKCESLLAESAGLLGEGVDMAAEGAGLYARTAADKDALTAGK